MMEVENTDVVGHNPNPKLPTSARRRGKLLLVLLAIAVLLFGLGAGLWFAVTQPVSANPQAAAPAVDASRLEKHVRTLTSSFFPRSSNHAENLDLAAAYIREEFEQANATVSEQPYDVKGTTYRNVIASFGPDTKEKLVIGAHYDSAGDQPAADDNASGIAGLIELAGLLNKAALPLRVELVAYSLEEQPYFGTAQMGSAVHAASLKQKGDAVRCMISLEMIGYYTDAANSQSYPMPGLRAFYPSRGDFIMIVAKMNQGAIVRRIKRVMQGATPLPIYSINAPSIVAGIDFSDHRNYWDEGYDAVMITDTAFYRNANYHKASDTPDTLDYRRMAMVVQGVYAAILELAQ